MSIQFNKLRDRSGLNKGQIVLLTKLPSELVGQIRRGQRQAPKAATDKLQAYINYMED